MHDLQRRTRVLLGMEILAWSLSLPALVRALVVSRDVVGFFSRSSFLISYRWVLYRTSNAVLHSGVSSRTLPSAYCGSGRPVQIIRSVCASLRQLSSHCP